MAKMKTLEHKEKIGLALTEDELDNIVKCVEEVAVRMDVSADKGWGTPFIKKQVKLLEALSHDLRKVYDNWKRKEQLNEEEKCEVEYEGLPEENCENCE